MLVEPEMLVESEMLVKPGTVFVAPGDDAEGVAVHYAHSVTFVSLDYDCCYCLILDSGSTDFKAGTVEFFSWKVEEWLARGWTMIEV